MATREEILAAIERAKARMANAVPAKPAATTELTVPSIAETRLDTTGVGIVKTPVAQAAQLTWNNEQQTAINNALVGRSFVLIGAAGTGKTTTLRGLIKTLQDNNAIAMLQSGTQHLATNSPGIVLLSYTRRAVRNIARQMPSELRSHCLTFHKVLEYAPEYYEESNELGEMTKKMRFSPTKHAGNPLPRELLRVAIDESSMVSIELFEQFLDALPNPAAVQFIFMGDLNQLPPVYGQAVLGQKLLQLPIVELTQVYRQALESPIISLALALKNNNFTDFNRDAVDLWSGDTFRKADGKPNYLAFNARELKPGDKFTFEKPGRGKVTLHCWKKRYETEIALQHMQGQVKAWIDQGVYDPDEDLVLCPWDKSFGAGELNRAIADKLGKKRGALVYEVIAGFNKYYLAVGDKLIVDKQECIVKKIEKNPKYLGTRPAEPSVNMDRWGGNAVASEEFSDFSDFDVDALLGDIQDVSDRKSECSHQITVYFLDTESTEILTKAAELNNSSFGYAMTVHKAQGSECRKVFFLTHYCHSAMLFRELVYTGVTRAAEELYIVMSPMMLDKAAKNARIKGDTLKAKLEYFSQRMQERITEKEEE